MKSVFVLLLAMALWGIVHSVLASFFVKDMVRGMVGNTLMRGYRLFYNMFAGVSFLPVLYLAATLPDQPLYQISAPWSYIMMGGQAFALVMLFVAFLQTDSLAFVGVSQLFREKEEPSQLVTRGLYKLVRHPLYTFSLLLLWLSPSVSMNSFFLYLGMTLYFLIGAYFEERKLLREFGQAYAEYRRVTPMLIPGL